MRWTLVGGTCRQQVGRALCGSLVSKTSPAVTSIPLGFRSFIPGPNKRGLSVMGTISVVA